MNVFSKLVVNSAVVAAMVVGAGQVNAELINGSFEQPINVASQVGSDEHNQNFVSYAPPDSPDLSNYNTYSTATQPLIGWTVSGGSVDLVNATNNPYGWAPPVNAFPGASLDGGKQSLDLNGWSSGSISQTFILTDTDVHGLSFWYSNNPWGNGGPPTATVTVGDQVLLLTHTGASVGDMGWTQELLQFTGVIGVNTVTFSSTSPGTGGIVIDMVSIPDANPNASVVPEPSSFALLGLGGIGLAIGAYRRRRLVAV